MATEVQQVNGGLGLDTVVVDSSHVVPNINGDVVVVTSNGGPATGIDSSASSSIGDEPASIASSSSAPPPPAAAAPQAVPVAVVLPTYDDIFPALPGGLGGGGGPGPVPSGGGGPSLSGISAAARLGGAGSIATTTRSAVGPALPKIRSSNVQKAYRVAPEERRALNRNRFGETSELQKICSGIMASTGTDIQLTTSRDGTLNFLISGKEDATTNARRMLASEFQAQITQTFNVPKEHHRIILGKGGAKLSALEQSTGTRIQIPKQDDDSTAVRITGTRDSIEKAIHEIQLISNEAFSRHIERVTVPKIYHPFITGPFNRLLEAINRETGAKVNVPPVNVQRDEISITGERNAVLRAKERVLAVFEEKKRTCQTVSIEVKKPQHKYIVGPKGSTLNEIFETTGVSVEMPSSESAAETIILRGEPEKLANALAVLYQKAHSETEVEIEVPGWIQRHLLGPKGVKFQELNAAEFPAVNVNLGIDEGRIRMNGPVKEVAKATEVLKARAAEIAALLAIEEIKISDAKHIKFIVGKNGGNLKQIREETNATINVIDEASSGGDRGGGENRAYGGGKSGGGSGGSNSPGASNPALGPQFIRIEGTRESVAKAKAELQALLKKLENEVSYELVIERRFYGQIIGAKGEKIRDIRNKFNQVQVVFPEQNETSEKVVIRGAKKDAEACYKHLSQMNKELLLNNHRLEVPIFKQLVGFLQGKDSIKSIREETGTRIDVDGDGDLLVITGKKEAVERARDRIQALQATLADMSSVDIIIPAKIHHYMLGPKGRNIKSVMANCGGVLVNFPPEGSGSDKVQIRGPKEGVAKAKAELVAMSNDYQTNNYSEELKVSKEHHRYLIGRAGANINKLKEETGVRVYFSSDQQHQGHHNQHRGPSGREKEKENSASNSEEVVTITGKKEAVVKARALLEAKIKELEKTVEAEMRVDPKYHHLFVARRAAVCKQLYDDYGGVNVSFPPLGGGDKATPTSDRVQLKGAPECVEAVKGRIAEIIADHEAQVTIEVEVEAVHHRGLLTGGPRSRVNGLQAEHDVRIKFPARPKTEKELQQQQANGENQAAAPEETEEEKQARAERANTVLISGRAENCEAARRALLALVPVTATVAIPYEFHRYVIGQKGVGVRELMDRCNVNIRVPPQADKSDLIYVTGSPEAVERAREELAKRLAELEGEKADRQARSYSLSFPVNPVHHPKIIGKKGAVISKIRTKHNVQINVPESGRGGGNGGGGEAGDLITVIGYEKDALAAKETILAIVKEQEDLVTEELSIDNRIHSRLIGGRGAAIRKVMSQFKVDIRFPKTNAAGEADPDLVLITGLPEAVEEAREHLLEVADTYLDDIDVQYQPPTDHQFHINFEELSATATVKDSKDHHGGGGGGRDGGGGGGKGGFQVRGGPWEKKNKGGGGHNGGLPNQQHNNGPAPDTNNAQEFPAFGGGPGSADPSSPTADGGLGDDQMNTVGTAWARKNGFN